MAEILGSPYFIALIFFVIAFVYSSVGLGGGSSYTAMMALFGFGTLVIPILSLSLNFIVTTIGSYNFIRHHHAKWSLVAPFLLSSIPMAYYAGTLKLSPEVFYWILFASLGFVALRIYFWKQTRYPLRLGKTGKLLVSLVAGGVLGFIAGAAGIGGGIFLVPLIIILGLGTEKQAAACGAIFIWLNSAAGLASRLQYNAVDLFEYWPLVVAVLLGGVAGSYLGATRLSPRVMEKVLGLVVVAAMFFLARKLFLF